MVMETGTGQKDDRLAYLPAGTPPEKLFWLVDELTVLAECFGESGEKLSPQRLQIYAADLADLDRQQLEVAFRRARRECRFFPKIAELRQLAGADPAEQLQAEAHAAWDEVMKFVQNFVSNDVFGNFGPEHGWHPRNYPRLSDRILDTVRRTGGWKVYKCTTDEDFPFVQKRFLEEYEAWTAVEQVPTSRLLAETPQLQLVGKDIDQPVRAELTKDTKPAADVIPFKLKSIPEPLTDAQIRDRREMLRQQAASLPSRAK
jgi:hypothetical protein